MWRTHILPVILAMLTWISMPLMAHSQTDEQALIEAVRNAEAEVNAAQARLQQVTSEYQPKIDAYQAAVSDLDRLREETGKAYDEVDQAYKQVDRLPVSLTARRDALTDILIRMYERNDPPSAIRQRERELEDVRRQIAQFEQDNVPAKIKLAAARAKADRLWKELEDARAAESRLQADADTGASRISTAKEDLAKAREELERIKSNARWKLNRNAPPFLERVTVKQGSQVFYDASWKGDEEDAEDLLKLAQYLHEDLSRTIPERQRRVDDWIAFVEEDQKKANAAMQRYVDYMGGSHDGGFWGGAEYVLDSISGGTLGALVTGGAHPWKKIGVELGDSALTIFRDSLSDGVPWQAAVLVEAASQLGDAGIRAWKGEAKNPSWDVTKMPYASAPVASHKLSDTPQGEAQTEKQMFDSINKQRVRASLERMHDEVKAGLKGEDFRDKLLAEYNGKTLAVAFSKSTITQKPPVLNFDGRNPISGSTPPEDWVWNLFTQPSGMLKTTLKTRFYEGLSGNPGTIGKDMFLDALQSAARDGLLEALERERLEIWYDWVMADADLQFSVAGLKNESRIRRMDEKMRRILAEEVIPELTREVESQRATRSLKVETNAGTKGDNARLTLEFTDEVVIEKLVLGGIELEPRGKGRKWRADIDISKYEDAQNAQLIVTARHAALEDRQLDDPKTVASWSTANSRFNAYEQKPDAYHTIKLTPPAGVGYAIVLDTSGSMEENGRMGQAKSALSELFASGRITEKDMTGLFTFSGCGVSKTVPFTQDISSVQSAIAGAGTYGDTPLARSIIDAANDLSQQNVRRGVLIVVTDGQDSCNGDVGAALTYARETIDNIRQRIVR